MASHPEISKNYRFEFSCHHLKPSTTHRFPFSISLPNSRTSKAKSWKLVKPLFSTSCNQSDVAGDTLWSPSPKKEVLGVDGDGKVIDKISGKKRVFFLDVNPLCYKGSTPSLHSFARWISLFFSLVSLNDPVIAVLDGERCNDYRRQLLPSYKTNRRKMLRQSHAVERSPSTSFSRPHKLVIDFLQKCNVPVVKIDGHEADDVVATLVDQVLSKGYRAVIASPDKDFRQLISEDVQIVIPVPELERWSFYTLKHYIAQYNCDPQSDLSLRMSLYR